MRIYLKREDIIFICSQLMKVYYQDFFTSISFLTHFCIYTDIYIYISVTLFMHSIMLIRDPDTNNYNHALELFFIFDNNKLMMSQYIDNKHLVLFDF